jgi:hypothetical protein
MNDVHTALPGLYSSFKVVAAELDDVAVDAREPTTTV